jgi:O-antigen/teichoic acid export membrane protein
MLKDSLLSGVSSILGVLTLFVLLPIFVNNIGIEVYGIFSIFLLLLNISSYIGFGVDAALVKFLSSEKNKILKDVDIIISILLMLASSFIFGFILLFFKEYIIYEIFSLDKDMGTNVNILYFCMTMSGIVFLFGGVLKAILSSEGRVYIFELSKSIHTAVFWISIALLSSSDVSFDNFGIALLVITSIWIFACTLVTFRLYGGIGISKNTSSYMISARKHIRFCSKIFVGNVFTISFEPLSKILVVNYFGATSVGIYDISLRLKNQIQQIITKITYPLYSEISRIGNTKEQLHFVVQAEILLLYVVTISLPLLVLLLPILTFMLPDISNDVFNTVLPILMSYLIFSSIVTPGYYWLMAIHNLDRVIMYHFIVLMSSLVLFMMFNDILGYQSIIIGNAMAYLAGFPIIISRQIDVYSLNGVLDAFVLIIINIILILALTAYYELSLWWFASVFVIFTIQIYYFKKRIVGIYVSLIRNSAH